MGLFSVFAFERYETSSYFFEGNAGISSLQWIDGNSRLGTVKELLASATSENDQLKTREYSRPAFIPIIEFLLHLCLLWNSLD